MKLLDPKTRKHLAGIFRVSAYGSFAFTVAALLASRAVYADVKEATLAASRQLAHLSDLTSGAETLRVNGEELHRASAFTGQSLHEVLDRYEAYCTQNPGALGRAMEDIPAALTQQADAQFQKLAVPVLSVPLLKLGIVREEAPDHGMVACFADDPDVPGSASEARPVKLAGRVERYLSTGNLSAFGRFRQVYVERARNGETHVVTTWANGDLNVGKMFPAEGDAQGTDSPFLPRPPQARRLLSGSAEGMPFGVRVYESTAQPEALWKTYETFLSDKGFHVVDDPKTSATRTYLRNDTVEIFVTVTEDDGKAYVTLLETAASGTDGEPVPGTVRVVSP